MVHPGGPLGPGHGPNVTAEGWLDAGAWRYTEELAEFARKLAEAEERLLAEEQEDPAEGYEVTVPDPKGNSTVLRVSAHGERVDRLERELRRVVADGPNLCPPGQSARANSHGSRTSSRTGSSRRTSRRFSSSGAMSS